MFAGAAVAGPPPQLGLPADRTLGQTCHIQNYVDDDPGPGVHDYMCRSLSYDGHEGTDLALPSLAAMRAGVDVIAPAPGTVLRVRDSMPDRYYSDDQKAALKGRDCGNGVVIDHGDGWQSQLYHMTRGSIVVRPGDIVARGDVLGRLGLSGRTEFPHVHLGLRKDGATVDPFRPDASNTCGAAQGALWLQQPAYLPGGLLNIGFATGVPTCDAVRAGTAGLAAILQDAPALVVWVFGFGGRAGDVIRLSITGPDGTEDFTHDTVSDKTQAQYFRAAGRRARTGDWTPRRHTGHGMLLRDGAVIDSRTETLIVE